eukprot:scaffold16061_cov116-Isochrysis_galbana.AAC.1
MMSMTTSSYSPPLSAPRLNARATLRACLVTRAAAAAATPRTLARRPPRLSPPDTAPSPSVSRLLLAPSPTPTADSSDGGDSWPRSGGAVCDGGGIAGGGGPSGGGARDVTPSMAVGASAALTPALPSSADVGAASVPGVTARALARGRLNAIVLPATSPSGNRSTTVPPPDIWTVTSSPACQPSCIAK